MCCKGVFYIQLLHFCVTTVTEVANHNGTDHVPCPLVPSSVEGPQQQQPPPMAVTPFPPHKNPAQSCLL